MLHLSTALKAVVAVVLGVLLALAVMGVAGGVGGHAPAANPSSFTKQVFQLGGSPGAMTFDGTNLWVANFISSSVQIVRPLDGAVIDTKVFSDVPPGPIAYDSLNGNVWVALQAPIFVDQPKYAAVLRASNHTLVMTVTLGVATPTGIAFDGANMWFSTGLFAVAHNGVRAFRGFDGAPMLVTTASSGPGRIAVGGGAVWVANAQSDNVSMLRPADGLRLLNVPVGHSPAALAFDGANIWVANSGGDTLTVIRASDGVVLRTIPAGSAPGSLCFDQQNMWALSLNDWAASVYQPGTGALLGTVVMGPYPSDVGPSQIQCAAGAVWVTGGDGSLTKITGTPTYRSDLPTVTR